MKSLPPEIKWSLIAAMGINAYVVAANAYAVSSIGYGGFAVLFSTMFALLPLLAAIACVPVFLLGALFKRTRQRSLLLLAGAVLYAAAAIPIMRLSGVVRSAAFHRLGVRSRPVVDAIVKFERVRGRPPETLNELVPDYLPSVPTTGMPAYPHFQYSSKHKPQAWSDNPWVLWVDSPMGALNWDMFMYFPKQNYPDTGYGGVLEPLGEWAYVHE